MSQRPLPYWAGAEGSAPGRGGSLYERKMKRWIGFVALGLAA